MTSELGELRCYQYDTKHRLTVRVSKATALFLKQLRETAPGSGDVILFWSA